MALFFATSPAVFAKVLATDGLKTRGIQKTFVVNAYLEAKVNFSYLPHENKKWIELQLLQGLQTCILVIHSFLGSISGRFKINAVNKFWEEKNISALLLKDKSF